MPEPKLFSTKTLMLTAALAAFGIGCIHLLWFYPQSFDGDSAGAHVLAKAILQEGSLLPKDFSYGNQLVFLRSSPFIAIAVSTGLTGYAAFAAGSALSLAFWGLVLAAILSAYLRSMRAGVLFAVLLLIPMTRWESYYLVGSQSHLSNAVLSLGITVFAALYLSAPSRRFLAAACTCLFLMSLESPARGLLVLGPVLLAAGMLAPWNAWARFALPSVGTYVAAHALNFVLIGLRPIRVNHFEALTLKSSDVILNGMLELIREAFRLLSNVNDLAGQAVSPGLSLLFILGLAAVLGQMALIFYGPAYLTRLAAKKLRPEPGAEDELSANPSRVLLATALTGLLTGTIAVAAFHLDPTCDTLSGRTSCSIRHYLWAAFLLKAAIVHWFLDCLCRLCSRRIAWGILMATALALSSWTTSVAARGWQAGRLLNPELSTIAIGDIERVSRETGIRRIYGVDFWQMMPLNTLVADLDAQTLVVLDGTPHPFLWLTPPSWSCASGEVLYLLRESEAETLIRQRLSVAQGRILTQGPGYEIWEGPPVWLAPANCLPRGA